MKPVFSLSLMFCVLFSLPATPLFSQESPAKKRLPAGNVNIIKTPEGVHVLRVAYPGDAHKDISLEVRILDDATKENPALTIPLYFNTTTFKEKDNRGINFSDVIFATLMEAQSGSVILDRDADDPTSVRMDHGNTAMSISGRLSAMGPRQVSVRCIKENTRTGNEEITVVFPYLSTAKMGGNPTPTAPREEPAFLYDLADKDFIQPQKLLVWLLSGEKILLKAEVNWPGR